MRNWKTWVALSMGLAASAAGCESGSGSGVSSGGLTPDGKDPGVVITTPDRSIEVTQAFVDWQAALASGSATTLMSQYIQDDNTVVMWPVITPGGDDSYSVTWQWEVEAAAQTALFTAFNSVVLDVGIERVIFANDSTGLVAFDCTLSLLTADSQTDIPARGTVAFARQEGQWKIVHEHLSIDPAK